MGQFTFVACSYKKLEPKIRFLRDFFPWKPFLASNFDRSKLLNHNFSFCIQNQQNIVLFLRNLQMSQFIALQVVCLLRKYVYKVVAYG
jgi:hypothetical protein